MCLLRRGVVSTSPNPQTGGPPLIGCLRLLMQFIHSYPPYRRPFLHPQPEDAPCRGDRDPHKYIYLFIYLFSKSTQNNGGHLNSQLFHLIRVIGITACDRLDGLGFETWRGTRSCTPVQTSHKIFHTCTDQPQGFPIILYNGYWGSFPGVKQPDCATYSAEVRNGCLLVHVTVICM